MLPGGGKTSTFNGVSPFVQGEWDWMQNPMVLQAMMGAGGMFQEQQQPMMQAPQLGPMPMGRQTPIQAPPSPQTPFQAQRAPWYGMFSG